MIRTPRALLLFVQLLNAYHIADHLLDLAPFFFPGSGKTINWIGMVHFLKSCVNRDAGKYLQWKRRSYLQATFLSFQVTGGQTIVNPWPILGGCAKSVCREKDFIRPDGGKAGV